MFVAKAQVDYCPLAHKHRHEQIDKPGDQKQNVDCRVVPAEIALEPSLSWLITLDAAVWQACIFAHDQGGLVAPNTRHCSNRWRRRQNVAVLQNDALWIRDEG